MYKLIIHALFFCNVISYKFQETKPTTPMAEDVQSENLETHPMQVYWTTETNVPSTPLHAFSSSETPTKRAIPNSSIIPCSKAGSFKELPGNCSSGMGDIERICGCDSTCSVLHNCCCDSPFVNADMPSKKLSDCVKGITKRLALSSPAFLVTKCPVDRKTDRFRSYCEDPSEEQLINNVPCYSPKTGLTYVNKFCSLCHNVKECIEWELTFQCNNPWAPFGDINTLDNMKAMIDRRSFSRRGCQFTVQPSFKQPVAHCVQAAIDFCPLFTSDVLSQKCHMYFNPVAIHFQLYRNIDCFYCNNNVTLDETSSRLYTKNGLVPLSFVLDLQQVEKQESVNKKPKTPSSIISKVNGFFLTEMAYAQITGANMTEVDANVLTKIDFACADNIKHALTTGLKAFDHKILLFMERKLSHQKRVFRLGVSIKQEILLGEIQEVTNATRAVSFSFQLDEKYNITCCFHWSGTSKNVKSKTHTHVGQMTKLTKRSDSPVLASECPAIWNPFPACIVFLYYVVILK